MTDEQPSASDTLLNLSVNPIANEQPILSGDFSGESIVCYANIQFSDYLNEVEYFPLSVFPAGMPRVEPISVFGEMVSDCTVLFDSAYEGIEDDDPSRSVAQLDYNPSNRHPRIPYTIIPPEEMYQKQLPSPVQAPCVSTTVQAHMKQEYGEQSLEFSQVLTFESQRQAPLFQGCGFQMPPTTNAEPYQDDLFRIEQQTELQRSQDLTHEIQLRQELRIPLPEFVVKSPLLDSEYDQPSTPTRPQRKYIYETPDQGTQTFPSINPPAQTKAHREDKQRGKSDSFSKNDSGFDVEKAHSQLTGTLMEIAKCVKLNPNTTLSRSFSSKSIEEIGPFHHALQESTMTARRKSDPENLDSVRWEKRMHASTMDKRSSPDAERSQTPIQGQYDSSSGQDSPTPKSKKARVQLHTSSKRTPTTARSASKKTPAKNCSTRKNTPLTNRTASRKAKPKDSSPDRFRLHTPSAKAKIRHPIPNNWEEASAEDVLLFELRRQGAGFPTIAEVLRTTRGTPYNPRTLRNRHWKIEHRLGEFPNSLQPNNKQKADGDTSDLSSPKFDTEEFNYF
ncbi:uncharacterized protein N7484_005504 [Penicillium longicatenatum]|uniref:uncharacterized protein n=1 Tax=Penicillium longicatenatum TaxID=1561947 RepID=UPI002546CD13|nr:uncharacterized protein N7484_005504 [Penicillium longicatenatum]KAJ5642997.1 hypothetical protein N7484_005504 [Penicillium longicatenatum]